MVVHTTPSHIEPNPAAAVVERVKKYQSLGQRAFVLTERVEDGKDCSYNVATFADFAQNVMPDVKWLDDYKRLRVFEEQLKKTGTDKKTEEESARA